MRQIQIDILSKLIELHPSPQTVLDVGCGNGHFTRTIASSLPYARTSAVDPKLSAPLKSDNRIQYFQSHVENLPFASDSFDVAVACMSFHHWNNKQGGLQEVFRILKPNGTLVVGDPFLQGIMRNRFMAWLFQVTDGGKFTSFEEMTSYLEDAGFGPMTVHPVASSFGTMFVISSKKPDSL